MSRFDRKMLTRILAPAPRNLGDDPDQMSLFYYEEWHQHV